LTTITRPPTNGVAHVSTFQYDYEKGELRVATDENSKVSKYSYNDRWNRLKTANFPDGGQKSYSYDDAGPNPSVSTSALLNSDGITETSTTVMDGVGHVLYTELTSDPYGTDVIQNTYDGNGLLWTKSNPYRGSSPTASSITTYYYDALGRPIETSQQDGSILQWCYDDVVSSPAVANCNSHLGSVKTGTWVDSTDENGNRWQRTSDSLGRLTEVFEPSGATQSPSMETDYIYDALNDLLSVKQCGALCTSPAPNGPIGRSFSYDSLSRLTSAFNPETGSVGYIYDANGNVLSKTDARSITTSYSYDVLNRVLSKTYSSNNNGTAISCYQYDLSSVTNGIGLLTNAWTQPNNTSCTGSTPNYAPVAGSYLTLKSFLAYDPMGRPTSAQQQQCIGSRCSAPTPYSLSMAYDLAGNMTTLTNSVGASGQSLTLNNYFDAAARPCLTASNWGGNFPANLFQTNPSTATSGYFAFGGLQNWYMGSTSTSASTACSATPTSPINLTQGYTNRLWVNSITASGQIP